MRQRRPRAIDKAHKGALARCPCVVCGAEPVHVAHVRVSDASLGVEQAGMAAKPSDRYALPLCPWHHQDGPDAEHKVGTVKFWRDLAIDPLRLADELFKLSPDVEAMRLVILRKVHGI